MWIPPSGQGFPPSQGRKEKLEIVQNGDIDWGRTGVSPQRPLRTPIKSPTKNIYKTKNLQKHYKIRKLQKKNKNHINQKNHKTEKPHKNSKTHKQTNQYVNILSTNAAGLKYKANDLKNKLKYFKSSIFSIQETHFPKKGRFKMDNFHIFEAIRKSKIKGGTMIGVHVDLQPILVREYSEQFELIVVEIKVAGSDIRIFSGYGPQENWQEKDKSPFFEALETEIASAEFEGKSVIICMDANSKLGPEYIEGDPHPQSGNGKLLAEVLDRHALIVLNGLKNKCTGVITRSRSTCDGSETSVIDFVIASSDLINHIEYIHIDDRREHVLTKLVKKGSHTKKSESDHNIIETRLNIPWTTKFSESVEVYNFKDKESQERFYNATNETNHLSKIFSSEKPLED